jgi:hypothetical protein
MEAEDVSETPQPFYQTTRRHVLEDGSVSFIITVVFIGIVVDFFVDCLTTLPIARLYSVEC